MSALPVPPGLIQAELRARREHARGLLDRPVWSLVLGESDEGLAALREALTRGPESGRGLAELAAILGDWDLAAKCANATLRDHVAVLIPGYREYAKAMLSLIAGDEDAARGHTAELESALAGKDKLRTGQPAAIAKIPRGLLDRDAAAVNAGVEAFLAWHLRRARVRSEVFNSSAAMISLEAIAAVLLAHRRGLSVTVDAKYRAARLPMLIIHTSEWEGRPLAQALEFSVEVDLVAGAWLRKSGLVLPDPAPAAVKPRAKRPTKRTSDDVPEEVVRRSLEQREVLPAGAWQHASWALMSGDAERARKHLWTAAEAFGRQWRAQGGANQNDVRAHFALALVMRDESALRETSAVLQQWMDRPTSGPRYQHASGHLDVLCELVSGVTVRASAEQIGSFGHARVAALALVARDEALLASALDGILADHAKTLERKSSPPPPVSETAATFAAAAHRLGLAVRTDEKYASHPVPLDMRNVPGYERLVARVPCDLLGRALWEPANKPGG